MSKRRTKYEYDEDDFYDDDDDDYDYDGGGGYYNRSLAKVKTDKTKKKQQQQQQQKQKQKPQQTAKDKTITKPKTPEPPAPPPAPAKLEETTSAKEEDDKFIVGDFADLKVDGDKDKVYERTKVQVEEDDILYGADDEMRGTEEDDLEQDGKKAISVVVAGHVDAGKSTLMGHLLYKLGHVNERTMRKYEKQSKELGKSSFVYAWVLDDLEEERARGVTVNVAVRHFETANRRVTLLDAPGHRDFIPNMIQGASQADVAILVLPASTGEFESSFQANGQTQEHAILLKYLGVRQMIVAINKMDTCNWSKDRFEEIKAAMDVFLPEKAGFKKENIQYIPVSGLKGENMVELKEAELRKWWRGATLIEALDTMEPIGRPVKKPLRVCVSDTFKTIEQGLTVSGRIEAGVLRTKARVEVWPQGEICTVKSIKRHDGSNMERAKAGENVDIGLTGIDANMIGPGSMLCPPGNSVGVATAFEANIATLEALEMPILSGTHFTFHGNNTETSIKVTKLIKSKSGRFVRKNEVATLEFSSKLPICMELFEDYRPLGRFLLRTHGVTVAAGVVTKIIPAM